MQCPANVPIPKGILLDEEVISEIFVSTFLGMDSLTPLPEIADV